MAVNKVIYGGNTLVDLTGDTVTAADLADGVKATGSDGNPIVGLMQKVTIDAELSTTSTNPVQNKVIKAALDGKINKTDKIYEANLEWGGRNLAAACSPVDAGMIDGLGANRFMFGKAAGITVEYSENAGTTWNTYSLTDYEKLTLFSTGNNYIYAGGKKDRQPTKNDMLRVTIDVDTFGVYTALNKFALFISTGGAFGCFCTIEASLENSPTEFKVLADKVPISGWTGYNIINTENLETYSNAPTRQYGLIRFTFGSTTAPTIEGRSGLAIAKIMAFGGFGWITPSNMAKNGHLYTYNPYQDATFPAVVTAPNFIGKVNGFDVKASVPANAKFTDTVYTHPATHPASMITGLSTVATSGSYNDLTDKPNIPASATVDSELSSTSTNPVQNKVIYNALLNKVGTDIYSGFALMGATSTIAWRQGSQPVGSINATNYTGTAAKATQDGAGNVITETYATKADVSGVVKSVNDTKPDASGNVTIAVSGGGVSTSESNTWSAQQNFHDLMLNREKYTTYVINGTSDTPITSTVVYAVTGAFTLDLATLAGALSASQSSVFTAYFAANADYSLTISNAGKLKYVGSASDVAITSAGLLLNIMMLKDSSGNLTSIVQASKLEGDV